MGRDIKQRDRFLQWIFPDPHGQYLGSMPLVYVSHRPWTVTENDFIAI